MPIPFFMFFWLHFSHHHVVSFVLLFHAELKNDADMFVCVYITLLLNDPFWLWGTNWNRDENYQSLFSGNSFWFHLITWLFIQKAKLSNDHKLSLKLSDTTVRIYLNYLHCLLPIYYLTQSQLSRRVKLVRNKSFPSPRLVNTKVKEFSLSHYLTIADRRIVGCILFQRILALCEMQTALSRIWT